MRIRLVALLAAALLLVFGPVGSYAHSLEHLHPRHHGHDGHRDHDDQDHQSRHAPQDCDLFGAHAPFGSAATVHVWVPEFSPPPFIRAAELTAQPLLARRVPFHQRAPPVSLKAA